MAYLIRLAKNAQLAKMLGRLIHSGCAAPIGHNVGHNLGQRLDLPAQVLCRPRLQQQLPDDVFSLLGQGHGVRGNILVAPALLPPAAVTPSDRPSLSPRV